VAALTGYPAQTPFTAIIDPDTASEEVVEVTNVAGTTLTVTRGVDGTTASSHNAGAVFRHGVSARDFDEANAFVNGGGVLNSLIQGSKGAIITSTGSAVAAQTVGANDTLLVADSAQTNGIKWSATLAGLTLTAPNVTRGALTSPIEKVTVSATAATGTVNFDAVTQGVLYYTTNASGNWTLNVRGNSGTTLNSILAISDSFTVAFLATNGSTPYYQTALQLDGSAVTPKWIGGSAPTSGNASSVDIYTVSIIKTANATFSAFAGVTKAA